MGYAARISLKQTIERLSDSPHTSLETLKFAYDELTSLRDLLEKREFESSSSGWLKTLVKKITDAEFELKYLRAGRRNAAAAAAAEEIPSYELRLVIIHLIEKVKRGYADEESKHHHHAAAAAASKKSTVVGLSGQISRIVDMLTDRKLSESTLFVSLLGMAGIGKTTLANEIYQHPVISNRFHRRVWVNLGPNYRSEDILREILAQIDPEIKERDDGISINEHFSNFLLFNRCLIVLDALATIKNASAVLVTTTLEQVAVFPTSYKVYQMRLLDDEESWLLLRNKVFDEMPCPPELVKPGKKIAEICEGLPLTIVTVADLLSKLERSPDCWKKVAAKENSVFIDAYDKMSVVLFPSYECLSEHLKQVFLYMGVFPQRCEIKYSNLINMWIAEGFLENYQLAAQCLSDLISRSLVMVRQQSTGNGIKTCSLHSAFWPLCVKEARSNKFFHVLTKYADGLTEDIKSQPRLCIHNNILFGIEDLNNIMASILNVSSVLCTGPYHQYPVPVCLDHSRLLRMLDALTIRFYLFPIEVIKLIELRYLALTYNGNLPSSISQLSSLECLIVGRHLVIRPAGRPPCLPLEIWDMKKLKHLRIMGTEIPDPCEGSFLPNLSTLSDMNTRSCTRSVLESIPNLKKLGIRIEISPDVTTYQEPLSCFDHISHLEKLESLKCVIVNPILKNPPPLSIFPSGLKKLSLSGLGYPWEEMSKIDLLPNLEVLKLRCCAFRGPRWEVETKRFLRLEFILIEDSDLVHWTAGRGSFPFLDCLSIKHCYKLQEIPRRLGFELGKIQVVDCSPSIVNWAKNLTKIDVLVHSSWDDRDLKK
ncbi:PREDICTED: putative late blight resistance protein homolog R1A-10 [Erythranthe guttata]|uniref:putative late blight resistance protein homolog R1A-10 n=1 Tax=Erythranthe guttata TaxID=4155 RepID=UPI00064D9E7C|nr:PREDICTED: putative late blight resistance protein homolog R1A-10 [Erythranthe guttata]|eukprot:XP_012852930.1 PREDICTED: putative late blight resistance protein homolog R1A-10 [Erythranthe guttata]